MRRRASDNDKEKRRVMKRVVTMIIEIMIRKEMVIITSVSGRQDCEESSQHLLPLFSP